MADAVFAGIAELEGIDALIPVAAIAAGLGIEAWHETLGAAELKLGLEGGILVAFHQGGGLLAALAALIGDKQRDGHGARGITLTIRHQAAMPAEVEPATVGPFEVAKAAGVSDLAVGEQQRLLAWRALPGLFVACSTSGSIGVGAFGELGVIAPAGEQLQLTTRGQHHADPNRGGQELGLGGARFSRATVVTSASGLVGLVSAAGLTQVNTIGGGEVVVGCVVAAQRKVGVGGNQEAGGVPAAG